jgi:hypothetical protein
LVELTKRFYVERKPNNYGTNWSFLKSKISSNDEKEKQTGKTRRY